MCAACSVVPGLHDFAHLLTITRTALQRMVAAQRGLRRRREPYLHRSARHHRRSNTGGGRQLLRPYAAGLIPLHGVAAAAAATPAAAADPD